MIKTRNLSFSYEEKMVLKNINIFLERGKLTCLLGANGSGSNWDIAEGIYYSIDQGADIINLSLGRDGSGPTSDLEKETLNYAYDNNVLVFAASGNEGTTPINYPAQYDSTVAVGSINENNERSSFSNYGPKLDLIAPGGFNSNSNSIYSTWGYYNNGDPISSYTHMHGTSMATPYASGVAALLISNGVTGVDNIKNRMTSTAVDLGVSGKDNYYGYGLVDAYGALVDKKLEEPYIFAGKEANGSIEVVSEVVQSKEENYQLDSVKPGEIKIYGWRDVNNNDEIDAGDYWGESNYNNVSEKESYTIDFNIYYVTESTSSGLTIKGHNDF